MPNFSKGLKFVSNGQILTSLAMPETRVEFIPDSNLVLALSHSTVPEQELPAEYREFITESRKAVQKYWHEQPSYKRELPVKASLAAMELSKYEKDRDRGEYDRFHGNFLRKAYDIDELPSDYAQEYFESVAEFVLAFIPSTAALLSKVYELLPMVEGTFSNEKLLSANKALLEWTRQQVDADEIPILCGSILYVALYAFAGSQEARRLLKTSQANDPTTAKNVAWDFLYMLYASLRYTYKADSLPVVCTSDAALFDLLRRVKRTHGQYPLDSLGSPEITLTGEVEDYALTRLAKGTKLANQVEAQFADFVATGRMFV